LETHRRFFLLGGAGALISLGLLQRLALAAQNETPGLPDAIAGIRLPLSGTAAAAASLARAACPPFLFYHSVRTYVFGALLAKLRAVEFDQEAIFIASCLHDLGLLERYQSADEPFELDGAQAAREFLASRGVDPKKIELICEAIAYHTSPLASLRPPQVSLVGVGAGADVFGSGLSTLPPARIDEVVSALPRMNFKSEFRRSLIAYCTKKPRAQVGTWTDAFCRSHVPDYHFPSIDERLANSPFAQ
jgi:hypothetical protein